MPYPFDEDDMSELILRRRHHIPQPVDRVAHGDGAPRKATILVPPRPASPNVGSKARAELAGRRVQIHLEKGELMQARNALESAIREIEDNENGGVADMMRDPFEVAVAETDLGDSELGLRIINSLERHLGVIYVGQLTNCRQSDFMGLPNFGEAQLEKIVNLALRYKIHIPL